MIYSVTEYGDKIGISRTSVLKRIYSGKIKQFDKKKSGYIIYEEPYPKKINEK